MRETRGTPACRLSSGFVGRNCVVLFTSPAGPLRLHTGALQRSLTERFFWGTHRNREYWLVSIYQINVPVPQNGTSANWNHARTCTSVNTGPAQAKLLHPCWCKCALNFFSLLRIGVSRPMLIGADGSYKPFPASCQPMFCLVIVYKILGNIPELAP